MSGGAFDVVDLAFDDVDDVPTSDATGERSGAPAVLLIMGLGADRTAWQPHVQAWRRTRRLLVVDNRGAGVSPAPPGPYSTAQMALDCARLLDFLDTAAVDVVGISMGSCIAQELALLRPDLVRRLVLVATWAACDEDTAGQLQGLTTARSESDPEDFAALLQSLVWTPQWIASHGGELRAARAQSPTVDAAAFAAQAAACARHDTTTRLSRITAATLVTCGDQDTFISAVLSVAVAGAIPGARLRRFTTGHVHHWEELEAFNQLVEEFLS